MAITVVGLLEADLPEAIEYKQGGVGPLFQEARSEEQITLYELLSRSIAAMKKLGIKDVVTCYIDDVELFRDDNESEESDFDIILRAAQDATADEAGISLHLMLAHNEKKLSHLITFEASVDHPADEAALSVLDVARLGDEPLASADETAGEEDADANDSGFASDAEEPSAALDPVDDDVTFFDERAANAEDLVDQFLQRVLAQLEKELGVTEPEIDVWTDWEGEFTTEPSGVPGLPGITG